MEKESVKGTKNYTISEQILREEIINTIKSVLEKYGFNPIETAILQPYKLLSSKYAGGEEILKECYKLRDQGNRLLGLRYELTITVVPYLIENPNIKLPFKKYEIGKIFRDGPIKKGRKREFTQFDADIIGCNSRVSDVEILSLTEEIFEKLGIKVKIKLNNRKILSGILEYAGIEERIRDSVVLSIDKLEKIGEEGVKKELIDKKVDEGKINKIFELISMKGENEEILEKLEEKLEGIGEEGVKELKEVLNLSRDCGLKTIVFEPSLARGLSYYTGVIYEVFSEKLSSSLAAGGRYDNLFLNLIGRELPSIGVSFGIDAICSILKPTKKSKVEAYLIPVGIKEEDYLPVVKKFREEINLDFDLVGRGISKNLEFADRYEIPFCLILGKSELKERKIKLKNMNTREEKVVHIKNAIEIIKSSLGKS